MIKRDRDKIERDMTARRLQIQPCNGKSLQEAG